MTATAQRTSHLHTFLSELVMQPHTATKCDGSVLDAGDCDLARARRCCNFRNFEYFARIEKLHVHVLFVTHWLGTGVSTAAQAQVVSVLNPPVLVNEGDIAGSLQGTAVGDEHFIGYFQQAGCTLVLLAFFEPPVERPGRRRQVFRLLCAFRIWSRSGIVHVCDERISGFLTGIFGLLPNPDCGGGCRCAGNVIHDNYPPGNPFPIYTVAPAKDKCEKTVQKIISILLAFILIHLYLPAFAAPEIAPDRVRGEGPFDRLILRGVIVINGEGAPPIGPMDVVIEGESHRFHPQCG